MTAPVEEFGPGFEARPEAVLEGMGTPIAGRSLGQIAWMRLKRDKVAIAGGVFVIFLIVVAIFAPLIVDLLGHPPNEFHESLVDPDLQTPQGGFGGASRGVLFGIEPGNGGGLLSRVVYGRPVFLPLPLPAP